MKRGNVGNGWKAAMAGMSVTAMICCAVCGSMAWLMDTTAPVTNTFTASKVEVKLEETEATNNSASFQMIPGHALNKSPKASIVAGSESAYLFIEVKPSAGVVKANPTANDYIMYAIDTGWTALTGVDNVYYRVVNKSDTTREFGILAGGSYTMTGVGAFTWAADQVLVLPTVTESMMETAETSQPTLKFKAHAIQLWKTNNPGTGATEAQIAAAQFTPGEAWGLIPDSEKITSTTTPVTPTPNP